MPKTKTLRPKGVKVRLLAEDPKTKLRAELITIKPGTTLPAHRHTTFEWVYVLEGELRDEYGHYKKGTFKMNSKNSMHTSSSTIGCTLLVIRAGTYVAITPPYAKK